MGGRKFQKLHGNFGKQVFSNEIRWKKICIDQPYQLYRLMIGNIKRRTDLKNRLHNFLDINALSKKFDSIDKMIEFENSIAHIIANLSFIDLTIDRQIFPVIVLDGRPPDLKKKTLDERKRIRKNAMIERNKKDKLNYDYIKYDSKCVELRYNHYKDTIRFMQASGLPVIQAKGEADSQCAALTCESLVGKNNIIGTITEDSDSLIFGGSCVIKGFTRKNDGVNILKLSDILIGTKDKINKIRENHGMIPINHFTEANLVDLSILCGTDYNEPISGLDDIEQKLLELFGLNDLDVKKVMRKLYEIKENNNHLIIPKNFSEDWEKVKEYYTNVVVIDPMTIDTTIKKPNYIELYKYLVDECCFKKTVVTRFYRGLVAMYTMYNKLL